MATKKSSSANKYILGVFIALAVAGAGYYVLGRSGKSDIKKKHARHVVMIHNAFVYKVWFSDPSIGEIKFIETPTGEFVPFDEEVMTPNEIIAVGLVIHENGTSITSSKALYPWLDNNKQQALRKSAQEICDHNHSKLPDLHFELTGGEHIRLDMYSRISLGREKAEITECLPVSSDEADEQNIGMLKPKSYAIPYDYADIELTGVNTTDLQEGKTLMLLGVNNGAFSGTGDIVDMLKGKITSNTVSSNIYYDFGNELIAEGAPVFDKTGRLVAINSVFSDASNAFLMGKKIAFTETVESLTQRNFQQDIQQTMELYETMNEVDKARHALDSLLQGIDTIGQGIMTNVNHMGFNN